MSQKRVRSLIKPIGALAITGALLATAGCGGGSAASSGDVSGGESIFDEVAALDGQERTDFLVDKAKDEGGVLNMYTSYSTTTLPAVVEAFEDEYGITVNSYRAKPEEIAQKLIQEAKVDFDDPVDIIESRGVEMEQLSGQGIYRTVDGSYLDDFPEEATFEDWTADRLNQVTPCWNTDAVPKGEEPTSWEDLATDRWKGRIAMESLDIAWFQTLSTYFADRGKSQDEIDQYWNDLADNSAAVEGHSQMQEMIVAGRYDVGVSCYTYIADNQAAGGAPTAWQPAVEPVVSQPNGVAIGASTKHPATAILFYDWILTDGQKVLKDTGNTVPTDPVDYESIPSDLDGYIEDVDGWSQKYDELIRGRQG